MELGKEYWERVSQAAEIAADPNNPGDTAAVLAATMVFDTLSSGRRMPEPTPELNAALARAEVLAL